MTGKLTGRGVLLWLLAFFGVVMGVNAWFVTVSATTFRGEDEQKPYLQGVEYNDTLARRAEQKKLGWQATIAADRLAQGLVRVTVHVEGRGTQDLALTGELRHPADENRDRPLKFTRAGEGLYQADLKGVPSGLWDVFVQAGHGQPFEADRRLWLR